MLGTVVAKYTVKPVEVENGKYKFFIPEGDYRLHVHRFGEPWLTIEEGSKALLVLLMEFEETKKLMRMYKAQAAVVELSHRYDLAQSWADPEEEVNKLRAELETAKAEYEEAAREASPVQTPTLVEAGNG